MAADVRAAIALAAVGKRAKSEESALVSAHNAIVSLVGFYSSAVQAAMVRAELAEAEVARLTALVAELGGARK